MNAEPFLPSDPSAFLVLTDALLESLKGQLTLIQPLEERRRLVGDALERLYAEHRNGFPDLSDGAQRQAFLHAFLSYDLIEEFLNDPAVEDIIINATEPIFVHKLGEGLVKTERRFATMQQLAVFVKKLLIFGGRAEADMINDLELADVRGRVNIIASPFGPQITITRGKPHPLTILQLIENGALPYDVAAQLWMYVEGLQVRPANLIISGGPGTGKTTLLNALLSFIPPKERVVTIEDTLELNTSFLENCSRLESCRRAKMDALVKNSLRMRPERILVGEVRGAEAHDLMTAINLGKYCMSTVHATSARETILRLQNAPMNVPPVLVSLVDVFVILRKTNIEGKVSRIVCELVETAGMEHQVVLLTTLWSYDHDRHQLAESSPSSIYRDKLATESGRTPAQIMEETARRAKILKRMAMTGRFQDIAAVTALCQQYSSHPDDALEQIGMHRDVDTRGKK
ncbi:MAG: Flp pilus assembly complex ATPase component TadA [Candidatus Omnitrophica bacterium]|nr:Flp pilus assembly complex ATPase component TadA [Candidatus Omnitrophota bacterium]